MVTAAQVTQVLYSNLSHFRLPPSHSHSLRGSWVCGSCFAWGQGVGVVRGPVSALASHFRVINASLRGRRVGLVASLPDPSPAVILVKQNLPRLCIMVICVYLPTSCEFLEGRGHV